jgi:predicted PurR-regulated permease PerM
VIQEVEGNVVHPMVMRGAVAVHPFVTLLALILFGSVFGLLGAILALPLVLAIQTVIQVLWVEDTLDAGDDQIEPVVPD